MTKILYIVVVLIILVLPFFQGGNTDYTIPLMEAVSGIVLLSGLVAWKHRGRVNPPFVVLGIWLAVLFLLLPFSSSPFNSLLICVYWASLAIFFAIFFRLPFDKNQLQGPAILFSAVGTVLSLIGFYFYLSGDYTRLTSTFYWPNPFAGYLLFVIPVQAYLLSLGRYRLVNSAAIVLTLAAFVLTGSRGAYISIVLAALAAWLVYRPTIRPYRRYILYITLATLCLILFFSILKPNAYFLMKRYDSGEAGQKIDSGAATRVAYWRGAWKIFTDNPFTGTGLGTFGSVYPRYQTNPTTYGKYPHNWYLGLLSETGIISFSLFAAFFILIAIIAIKNRNNRNALTICLGWAVLASLLHSGVDIDWHYPANALTFWILLGLYYNGIKAESNLLPIRKKSIIFGLNFLRILLGVFFFIFGASVIYSTYYSKQAKQALMDGQATEAKVFLARAMAILPDPNFHYYYSLAAQEESRSLTGNSRQVALARAQTEIEQALASSPGVPYYHEQFGVISESIGKGNAAELQYRQAIALDPVNTPRYYYRLASLLYRQNRLDEAISVGNSILAKYPYDVVLNRQIIITPLQPSASGIEKDVRSLYLLMSDIETARGDEGAAKEYRIQAEQVPVKNLFDY